MTDRTRVQIKFDTTVAAGVTDTQLSAIVPSGEVWNLQRIIFAHADSGNNISGGFQVDWGDAGGGWEFLYGAYLTGSTYEIIVGRDFVGDGTKRLRCIRQNLDPAGAAKRMTLLIEAFKKLGLS